MTNRAGILSLGTRADATTWEKGCRGLGFDVPLPIKKPSPTMDELKRFFASPFEWVFLAGHFAGRRLYNESGNVGIRFAADAVTLEVGNELAKVEKRDLRIRPHLILWGGCSTLGSNDLVRDLNTLFGSHTMVGFRGLTGWKVVDAALGAGFMVDKRHFFTRVQADTSSRGLTEAWMQTGALGWGGGSLEDRFAAVDTSGQRWILRGRQVVRDSDLF